MIAPHNYKFSDAAKAFLATMTPRPLDRAGQRRLAFVARGGPTTNDSPVSSLPIGPHPDEPHHERLAARLNWLRAAVLGANYPGNEWYQKAYALVQKDAPGVTAS